MNIKNLEKLIEFIPTIPDDKFYMGVYREDCTPTHLCNSIGCIVGWASALLTKKEFEFYLQKEKWERGTDYLEYYDIAYEWSSDFFDLKLAQWVYLFGTDNTNDKELAVKRVQTLIENNGVVPSTYFDDLPF